MRKLLTILNAIANQNDVTPAGVITTQNEEIQIEVSGALVDQTSLEAMDFYINDRFYKGGATFRGFETAGIGPRDTNFGRTDDLGQVDRREPGSAADIKDGTVRLNKRFYKVVVNADAMRRLETIRNGSLQRITGTGFAVLRVISRL